MPNTTNQKLKNALLLSASEKFINKIEGCSDKLMKHHLDDKLTDRLGKKDESKNRSPSKKHNLEIQSILKDKSVLDMVEKKFVAYGNEFNNIVSGGDKALEKRSSLVGINNKEFLGKFGQLIDSCSHMLEFPAEKNPTIAKYKKVLDKLSEDFRASDIKELATATTPAKVK